MAVLLLANQSGEVGEPEWLSPALIWFPPGLCTLDMGIRVCAMLFAHPASAGGGPQSCPQVFL